MTNTCPECGLSLQGRDNEAQTCSDCLLGLTDEQYKEPIIMTETDEQYKDLIEMTEELMLHIFDSEFGGELDPNHRFFELYLQLQLYKEKMLKDEEEEITRFHILCNAAIDGDTFLGWPSYPLLFTCPYCEETCDIDYAYEHDHCEPTDNNNEKEEELI